MPLRELATVLARHGLRVRGGFATDPTDRDLLAKVPGAKTVILVGNVGSELWEKSGADITATKDPDPLDCWTQRVVEPIAQSLDGTALYPFGGPPYWPFQRWAERAEGLRASPLGIQIHPEFGLWHAYRAAIVLQRAVELPPRIESGHPCDSCVDKPCLSGCPVQAFSVDGYAADRCVDHVVAAQHDPGTCASVGCLARLACPVGAAWRYQPDQARFHMAAFVSARLRARK